MSVAETAICRFPETVVPGTGFVIVTAGGTVDVGGATLLTFTDIEDDPAFPALSVALTMTVWVPLA